MFLTRNNQVKDKEGNVIEEGLCAKLFIGVDSLKVAYKRLICLKFPKRMIYTLETKEKSYVLGNPLYSELFDWIEENLPDIKILNSLFGVSFVVKVDDEERTVSVRDLLIDESVSKRNSPCCLSDLLASRLEATIESLM